MNVSAVIAAAGLSSRMRDFKPLAELNGQPVIVRVVSGLREAGVGEIVVTGGYRGEELKRLLLPMGVRVVLNRRYAETEMLHSLKMGIASLNAPADALFLLPGDVPLIRPETMRGMLSLPDKAVRPVCDGKGGHPLLLRAELIPALLDYNGPGGLRGALAAMGVETADFPVDDRGCVLDADTPQDLLEIRRQFSLRGGRAVFWPEVRICVGKGGYLVTPADVQFLEMIRQTGSIRRACACVHISYTKGWSKLRQMETELDMKLTSRNSGGPDGGGTSLTQEGAAFVTAYRRYTEGLLQDSRARFREAFGPLNA